MHRNRAGPCRQRGGVPSAASLRRRKRPRRMRSCTWAVWLIVVGACWLASPPSASNLHAAGEPRRETVLPQRDGGAGSDDASPSRELLDRYCVACHNERVVQGRGGAASPLAAQLRAVGLTLDTLDLSNVGRNAQIWEKVARKLRAGAMPPAGRPRPDTQMRDAFLARLEADLDAAWAARAELPRTAVFHRLNRAEYANVIRDLLALDVDVASLLPPDDASYGFDNIADALGVSPLLLERYLGAARRISRLAVGSAAISPAISTYLVPTVLTQNDHLDGLPLGTRGGIAVRHRFPLDGEYVVRVRLLRTVIDTIRGLGEPHQLEVSLDGERVRLFTIGGAQPRPDAFEVDDDADEEAREAARRAAREAALAYSMNADAALEVRCRSRPEPARSPWRSSGRPRRKWPRFASRCCAATSIRPTRRARRTCGAWPSAGRTARQDRGTRRAGAGCSSAVRIMRKRKRRARGESWRRSPVAPIAGR